MNLPKKQDVFGKILTVKIVKDLRNKSNDSLDGELDFKNGIMAINKELRGRDLTQTYLHECFHAVIRRVGINQGELSPDLEEVIVDSFSTFLVDNFHIRLK